MRRGGMAQVLKTMRVRLHHSCKYLDEDGAGAAGAGAAGAGATASGSGNDSQATAGETGKQPDGAEQKSDADAGAAAATAPAAPRRVQWKLRFDCTFSGAQNPGLFLSFFKRFVMELDYKTYPEYRAEVRATPFRRTHTPARALSVCCVAAPAPSVDQGRRTRP